MRFWLVMTSIFEGLFSPRLVHYSSSSDSCCEGCRWRLTFIIFWVGKQDWRINNFSGFATRRDHIIWCDEKGGTIIVHACWAGKKRSSFLPLSSEKACINRNKPCIKISVPKPINIAQISPLSQIWYFGKELSQQKRREAWFAKWIQEDYWKVESWMWWQYDSQVGDWKELPWKVDFICKTQGESVKF